MIISSIIVLGAWASEDARYTQESPLEIWSDNDLDQIATIKGWPGNGTVSNPYVIEGMEVDGTGETRCLYIAYVTKYLSIRDSWFHGTSVEDGQTDSPDIHVYQSENIVFEQVTVGPSVFGGVFLERSNDINFFNCTLEGIETGIWTENSNNIIMDGFSSKVISHTAIKLWRSQDVIIANSSFEEDQIGISIDSGSRTQLIDNTFLDDELASIVLKSTSNLRMVGNNMTRGGIHLEGFTSQVRTYSIDTSNKVHGDPIHLLMDLQNATAPRDAGQVIFFNCSYVDISSITLHNVSDPVNVFRCGRVEIDSIIINDSTWRSVHIDGVDDLSIANCTIQTNGGYCVYIDGYPGDVYNIENCTFIGGSYSQIRVQEFVIGEIRECRFNGSGRWGIYTFDNHGMIIENCSFTGLEYGLYIDSSTNFRIENNIFRDCSKRAIRMIGGDNSEIHHNTFYMNAYNRTTKTYEGPQAESLWDTYPWHDGSEGNWWSDYTIRYPDATNNGVVWDTPYALESNVGLKDPYPLVHALETIPPVASAGPDQEVDEDTVVTLDGSLSTDNWEIVDHTWTFETPTGPIVLNGAVVEHTFHTPGVYVVTLTVTDLGGNIATDNLTITVNDVTPPTAMAGEDIEVDEGDEVVFNGTGSSDNVGIVNMTWSIPAGEGELLLYGPTPAHVFPLPGTHTVTLTVWDPTGLSATDSLVVTVRDATPPQADAGPDKEVEMGSIVQLDASASLDNVGMTGFSWTFESPEGPVELPGKTASYRFDEPGEYVVTLNVTDAAGNWDTDTLTVTVRDTTLPIASAGEDITADQGQEITLDGYGSLDNIGVVAWSWVFLLGDEEVTLEGEAPTYTFEDAGVYEITLTVEDAAGNQATDEVQVTVKDIEPPVAVVQEDTKVPEGTTLTLDATNSTDNMGITGYSWKVSGPGGTVDLVGDIVDHLFTSPGNYTVTLLVVDAEGNSDDASFDVEVTKTPVPNGNGRNGEDDGPNYILYAIIAVIIVVVVVVVMLRVTKE
jgi:parallel beta-helix repeat protein